MQSVFIITIRRLRAPLILIIFIFALSTVGLSLIPGVDAQGQPWRMTIFEAFYFVTYTATTIGFGEIPNAFTDQQRLFVTLIIYLSVIGWAYLLGSLLGLSQDKALQQAIVSARFRRSVARLREPFYLVCGLGETGMTVVRALDKLGHRFTAIDRDERKIQELEIEDLSIGAPLLAADARSPETLAAAGLLKPECKGVLALCNDDAANLAIAVSACLLAAWIAGRRPGGLARCGSLDVLARHLSCDQSFPRVRGAYGTRDEGARQPSPALLADEHARLLFAAKLAAEDSGCARALDRLRLWQVRQRGRRRGAERRLQGHHHRSCRDKGGWASIHQGARHGHGRASRSWRGNGIRDIRRHR